MPLPGMAHRGEAVLGIRPESIRFESPASGRGPLVEVDAVERYGDRGDAWLRPTEGGPASRLVHRGSAMALPDEQSSLRIAADRDGLHVFEPGEVGRRLGPDLPG